MKKHNLLFLPLVAMFIAIMFFGTTSCTKSNNNTTDTGTLYLDLHSYIGTNEITAAGQSYTDALGRTISLSVAQFYLSNIVLTNSAGAIIPLNGVYTLKTLGNNEYMIGGIPTDNFDSISFNVGIDPTVNATAPASYAAASSFFSALTPQTPSMWFGTTTNGYIFMNIQGTAQDSVGKPSVPISYQIGSNTLLKTVTLPFHSPAFSVAAKQKLTIHLICDYGKLLQTVSNFASNSSTDTYTTNAALATAIAAGIPGMFRYQQ